MSASASGGRPTPPFEPGVVVALDRESIDRATRMLTCLSDPPGGEPLEDVFAEAIEADALAPLVFVLLGMASSLVTDVAAVAPLSESDVVGLLRARMLVVYAREG